MFNSKNSRTFFVAVNELLLTMCREKERIDGMKGSIFSFYTDTGIEQLSISPRTNIGILYLEDPSLFKKEIQRFSSKSRVVVFVNLSKDYIDVAKEKDKYNNITILFAPQLLRKIKFSKKKYRCLKPVFVEEEFYKKKCLHAERLGEYVNYLVRLRLLETLVGRREELVPDHIVSRPGQDSVFPFVYKGGGEDYYFFYEDNRQLKNNYYFNLTLHGRMIPVKLSIETDEDKQLFVKVINDLVEIDDYLPVIALREKVFFNKVVEEDLLKNIKVFNKIYGSFYLDDFVNLYKYRKFEKTRYDSSSDDETVHFNNPSLFKYTESSEVEVGSRGALEDEIIWFSNYKQLNDPFDLVFRKPTRLKLSDDDLRYAENYNQTTKSGFRTFCVTSRADNILMWSHYGYSHYGTCTRYPMMDILNTIENDNKCAICFYGNIYYSNIRPSFSMPNTLFRFLGLDLAILLFNVVSMFSKYKDWGYECEFRFLILPWLKDAPSFANGYGMKLRPSQLFLGKNFDISKYATYLIKCRYSSYKQFDLSEDEYKLILK